MPETSVKLMIQLPIPEETALKVVFAARPEREAEDCDRSPARTRPFRELWKRLFPPPLSGQQFPFSRDNPKRNIFLSVGELTHIV